MRIRFIKAQETWTLRHQVLRPHQTLEDCDYPNDRNPESFHLGVFLGERSIGTGSFYAERNDTLKGWKQYRLRGMAVHPEFRARGAGAELIRFALEHLRAQRADLLWCNARESAQGFYAKLGFGVHGLPFMVEGLGAHVLMHRRI